MNAKTVASLLAALAWPSALLAQAPPTCWPHCITYQGVLMRPGPDPVIVSNGVYRLKFRLYDSPTGGVPIELKCGDCADGTNTEVSVQTQNGVFTTLLRWPDNPPIYPQIPKWMEIATAEGQQWVGLQPRVPIVPVPFAHYAWATHWTNTLGLPPGFADGVDNDTTYAAGVGLNLSQNAFSVNFAGSGAASAAARSDHGHSGFMVGLNADLVDGLHATNFASFGHLHDDWYWKLLGNSGTTAGTHFLGTTDDEPLEFKVYGSRALRLEPNTSEAPNVIGGARINLVGSGVVGATIAGGGAVDYTTLGAIPNRVLSDFGSIGGGSRHRIETGANSSTIAGGYYNEIETNANAGAIGGGRYNSIGTGTRDTVIAGGYDNDIGADSDYAVVGGGHLNKIGDSALYSLIGGGRGHQVFSQVSYATISGGRGAACTNFGQWAYASGPFGQVGDAQSSLYVLRGETTPTTRTNELFLNQTSERIRIRPASVVNFDIQVAARSSSGNYGAGFRLNGVIERTAAGLTSLIGTVDSLAGFPKRDLADWSVQVVADDVNDALVIRGVSNTNTVRWVATVRTSEVLFP
jgi:hypothetical protein